MQPAPALLTCAAALLDQGRVIDRLSRLLTAAALAGSVIYPAAVGRPSGLLAGIAIATVLSGLAETYLAMRVAFDAALFRAVANAPGEPDFAGLDEALVQLHLLPASKRGRPADARIAGARRLFTLQIAALVIQVLCLAIGAGAGMVLQ